MEFWKVKSVITTAVVASWLEATWSQSLVSLDIPVATVHLSVNVNSCKMPYLEKVLINKQVHLEAGR